VNALHFVKGGSASPKTMPKAIAEGARKVQAAVFFQHVEDNAFHLSRFSAAFGRD